MAWFVTPRLRFLHVPKTGGSWATDAMCAAGVAAAHPEPSPIHATLADSLVYRDRFTVAFVRHPLDYWRSYWAYRVRTGWDALSPLDRVAGSGDFEEFIERVIDVAPGAASSLFESFVGPPGSEIGFVGRYERLVDDVCFALRIGGESFDERVLRSHPKVNCSEYGARGARYPRSLAARLAEAEQRAIDRFYPWEPMPARVLLAGVAPPSRLDAAKLAGLTLELRDARAELEQVRGSLRRTELARREAHDRLTLVENSFVQRRTRRLRRLWYRHRAAVRSRIRVGLGGLRTPLRRRSSPATLAGGRPPSPACTRPDGPGPVPDPARDRLADPALGARD